MTLGAHVLVDTMAMGFNRDLGTPSFWYSINTAPPVGFREVSIPFSPDSWHFNKVPILEFRNRGQLFRRLSRKFQHRDPWSLYQHEFSWHQFFRA